MWSTNGRGASQAKVTRLQRSRLFFIRIESGPPFPPFHPPGRFDQEVSDLRVLLRVQLEESHFLWALRPAHLSHARPSLRPATHGKGLWNRWRERLPLLDLQVSAVSCQAETNVKMPCLLNL